MSQTDKKRRKLSMAIGESFAAVRRRVARSDAWLSLSAPALKIYIELRLRWRHSENNNGELFISFDECARLLHLPHGSAARGFKELEQKGFIVKTRQGDAGALNTAVLDNGGCGHARRATTWALTEEVRPGHAPTHAYEKWKPDSARKSRKPPKKQFHGSVSGTIAAAWFRQWNHRRRMVPSVEQ